MSSVIAVSVSLVGLSAALFTLVIFIQMILSFPAMLSSNSQAYVQQQRKLHHIRAAPYDGYDESDDVVLDDDENSWEDSRPVVIDDEEYTRGRTLRRQASVLDSARGCPRRVNRLG